MDWQASELCVVMRMANPVVLPMELRPPAIDNPKPEALWLRSEALPVTVLHVCVGHAGMPGQICVA